MFLKINAEHQPAVAKKYGVTGYPTIKFLDSDGNAVHEAVGYRPLNAFLQEMNKARGAN